MNATTPAQTEEFDATELGAMMREMRENLGHDLEKVADDLRIRLVYLEAIETGRLGDLPGNAYVSGFLRAYSDYLGLDGEEIVRRFKMAGAEISNQTQLHLPSPVEEGRLPTAFILMVAAVIAAGAYGGWYYLSSQGSDPMETVAKLPSELSGLVEDAANQTSPAPVPAQQDSRAESTQAVQAPQTEDAPSGAPQSATTSDAVPAGNAVAAPETATGSPAAPADAQSGAVEANTPGDTAEAPITPDSPEQRSPPAASEPDQTAAAPAAPAQPETPAAETTAPAVATTSTEAPVPAPAPAARAEPVAETPPAPAPVSEPAPVPAPAPTVVETPVPAETPDQTAAVTPAPAPAQPASRILPGDSPDVVRIVVRATADSYVAVKTADGQPLFSQLMRPGDSYEVPSGADLVLETGNAGGLQISVGDRRVPSLGPMGQVRRNIPLDAEGLLSGAN